MSPWFQRVTSRELLVDVAIAAGLTGLSFLALAAGARDLGPSGPLNLGLLLFQTVPLARRSVAPVPVLLIIFGAIAVQICIVPVGADLRSSGGPLVALYTIGERVERRFGIPLLIGVLVLMGSMISVIVIVIQAGAALRWVGRRPEDVRTALEAIHTTGRQALTDMRRMLGILGSDGPSAPQPGLDRLGDLNRAGAGGRARRRAIGPRDVATARPGTGALGVLHHPGGADELAQACWRSGAGHPAAPKCPTLPIAASFRFVLEFTPHCPGPACVTWPMARPAPPADHGNRCGRPMCRQLGTKKQ